MGAFELVGDTDQFNDRFGAHLLHDVASVDFYCRLTGSDFVGDLLIEHSANYQTHDLPLSRGQFLIALLQIVDCGLFCYRSGVTLEGQMNCVKQILVSEGFR